LTDLDESDQIGLTSFNSWTWSADKISNDESMWARCIPRNFGSIQQAADIVFIFGSGYISLKKGETKRISMALLFGQTLDDLLTSAKTVQTIYNQNYRFFKPPLTPRLTAVPGDRKVTLYWDSKSEQSVDPISGKDFEGYVIYRSTDPSFGDIQTITDGHGSQFLSEPLKTFAGTEARWDVDFREEPYTDLNFNGRYDASEPFVDLNHDGLWSPHAEDPWKGFHPVPYQDRGVQYYLGNNSGLVHSFVDSNNVINGQTYYYAVVAYDHGDSVGIPPTETTKKITVDPITSELDFDVNTAMVVPGPRANGYVPPQVQNGMQKHVNGLGTGPVTFRIVNDLQVPAGGQYRLTFADSLIQNNRLIAAKNYSVLDLVPFTQTFTAFDTNYVQLEREWISPDEYLKVTDKTGRLYSQGTDFLMNYSRGSIRRTAASTMPPNGEFQITYRYFPVFESRLLKGEDGNPAFAGIELTVTDEDSMGFDPARSGWVAGRSNLEYTLAPPSVGVRKKTLPADYTIRFSSTPIDSAIAVSSGKYTKVPVTYSVSEVTTGVPRPILTYLYEKSLAMRNLRWDPGEEIELFQYGSTGATTDTLNWGLTIYRPADTSVTPVLPTDGDLLFVGTSRAFTTEDVFTLQTQAGHVDASAGNSRLDSIYVVPNPYVAVSQIEPTNKLPGQTRGERRIYFEHLPQLCTIRIFTLNGDLVQVLNHDVGVDNAREYWNLLDRDGFSIAYGIYVAHIDAPGIGEKMLKFAVIK
jgi:hypothetical protein